MGENIFLNELLNINPSEYKDWTICLNNGISEQIYSFDGDEKSKSRLMQHISWKKSAGAKSSFRQIYTKYCLEFIRLDKDSKYDEWLFLGAFKNDGIISHEDGHETFDLKKEDRFSNFAEKLVVKYKKHQGDKQAKIRINLIETMQVVKVLENKYIKDFKPFEGYDNIRLSFIELKQLITSNCDSWRELLSNVNAIYVITDLNTGKLYVGSTYGERGVWQRWYCYVYSNGHGGDKELKKLVDRDNEYAINNFQFSILEVFLNQNSNDKHILDREKYWKKVLYTKERGNNDN